MEKKEITKRVYVLTHNELRSLVGISETEHIRNVATSGTQLTIETTEGKQAPTTQTGGGYAPRGNHEY